MILISFNTVRDLAGPIATIIASLTAAFVTWRIQQENRQTKKDELRMALFSRRYQIYAETVDYARFMLAKNKHDPAEEVPRSQAFDRLVLESRFTCSTRVQQHLEGMRDAAFEYAFAGAEIEEMGDDKEERHVTIRKWQGVKERLDRLLRELPTAFEGDLKLQTLD